MKEMQEETDDTAKLGIDESPQEPQIGKTVRPHPIVLLSLINLMKLNGKMQTILKGKYKYTNT
jgi:hypothetical protein